jgi:predicted transposase/invertase (TIGR01784 family)
MHAKDSKLLLPKSDFIFSLLFGNPRNIDLLTELLQLILNLPAEEYKPLTILNPHLKPEMPNDKLGILDIKVGTKNNWTIDMEMQVRKFPDLVERILFYMSMMTIKQIGSGDDYDKIKPVIGIFILDYIFFPGDKDFHHIYHFVDEKTKKPLTNLAEIHILELPKVKATPEQSPLSDWLRFIHSDTEEEMMGLAQRNPQINRAYGMLKKLSANKATRFIDDEIEKSRRDQASYMAGARREGIAIGEAKGIAKGAKEREALKYENEQKQMEIERLRQEIERLKA